MLAQFIAQGAELRLFLVHEAGGSPLEISPAGFLQLHVQGFS